MNCTHFTEPEGSLPCSLRSAKCPYPEPDQSSPQPPNPFPQNSLNSILLPTPMSSKWCLSLSYPTKPHTGPKCQPSHPTPHHLISPSSPCRVLQSPVSASSLPLRSSAFYINGFKFSFRLTEIKPEQEI
jgi:hypothetical protein